MKDRQCHASPVPPEPQFGRFSIMSSGRSKPITHSRRGKFSLWTAPFELDRKQP